jgi:hypothetical protein
MILTALPELDSDERRLLLRIVEEALLNSRLSLHGMNSRWTFYGPVQFEIRTLEKIREVLL